MEKKFTVLDGLHIQAEDLARWRKKLNAEVYTALKMEVDHKNFDLSENATGYDVFRGQSLTEFVLNFQVS